MVHLRLRHALLVGGVVALLGSACNPTSAAAPALATPTRAAQGTPFATARFTASVPNGWTDDTGNPVMAARLGITDSLLMLVDAPPPGEANPGVNDLRSNIVILVLTQPVPDTQLPQYLQSVKASGATNLSSTQAFTVDGVAGVYITYDRDISGTPATTQDMVVNQGGSTYNVQLNATRRAFAAQLGALHEILDSWRWTTTD